ncbi:MAG: hypothetical protein U5L96_10575 [Owenweeksia sp.]|nr:hypothetical protein [Owenweeksia sp.]
MCPWPQKCECPSLSVASSFEAEEVLEVCRKDTRIMIMGIIDDEDVHWAIEHGIEEVYVFNYERLPLISLKRLKSWVKKHIFTWK